MPWPATLFSSSIRSACQHGALSPRAFRFFLFCSLTLCLPGGLIPSLWAQHGTAESSPVSDGFAVTIWKSKDGLPSDRIRSIIQDSLGFLWIGTFNGIARFDGVRFRHYTVANSPQLSNNLVNLLFQTRSGRLLVGHETGHVTEWLHHQFAPITTDPAWLGSPVDRFVEAGDGTVWLLNRRGWLLSLSPSSHGKIIANVKGKSVTSLAADNTGTVWGVAGQHIFAIENGQPVTRLVVQERLPAQVFAARAGGIWVAGISRIRRWHDGAWREERVRTDIRQRTWTNTWTETSEGVLAATTFDEGLLLISRHGHERRIALPEGLPSPHISALAEDSEGNLWAGLGDQGLCQLRQRSVAMLSPPDGWRTRAVQSVIEARDGTLWAATEGAGLYRCKAGEWTHYDQQAGLTNQVIKTLAESSRGDILVGLSSGGVLRLENDAFRPLFQHARLSLNTAIFEDSRGRFWLGGLAGPTLVSGNIITAATPQNHQGLTHITAFAESPDGTVWIGSLGYGLGRYRDGVLTVLRRQDGLPSDYIWSLRASTDGTLWIGTYDRGLVRHRDDRFALISTEQGLPGNRIGQIVEDRAGQVWLGTEGGIVCIERDALNRCAEGLVDRIAPAIFDLSEGLASLGLAGGNQSTACLTRDGNLLFATDQGLAQIAPHVFRKPSRPIPIVIDAVRVEGKDAEVAVTANSATVHAPPGASRLEIDYAGLNLSAPHRVRFRYRLDGIDNVWTQAETRRTAYFSHLRAGTYTFRVQAIDGFSNDTTTGTTLQLHIAPYFWETAWFKAAAVFVSLLVAGGIVGAVLHVRHRRRLERLEREHVLERDRTRIAHDLHDEIGSGLTQLTFLSHSALAAAHDPQKVSSQIQAIRTTTSDMTESIDEIVWAVNPRHDSLESLLSYAGRYVQEFCQRTGLGCTLEVPLTAEHLEMTAESRHELFLALKEAINNIAKHAHATEVRFSLHRQGTDLLFIIEDNGNGFSTPANPTRSAREKGIGLESMHQRMTKLGGTFTWGNHPVKGARLTFRVPLSSRRQ